MKEINNSHFVLHFFQYQKFTEDYIKFINKNFDESEQVFILFGDINEYVGDLHKISMLKNVFLISEIKAKDLLQLLRKSNKVVQHGLFNYKIHLLISLIARKKHGIVFWGGDIDLLYNKPANLEVFIKHIISKLTLNNTVAINLISNDYKILNDDLRYKFKKHYLAAYYTELYEKQIIKLPYHHNKEGIKILLGNSATKTNNHFEVIDKLSLFEDELFTVYIPLSYGDSNYANEVEKYAKLKLKDKAVVITKFLKPTEYNEFLNMIDIGIFNYYRQQGLGNINRLLILRKKVFINYNSGLLEHYKKMGIKIYETNDISAQKFSDFIQFDEDNMENNRKILIEELSNDNIAQQWNKIFSDDWS